MSIAYEIQRLLLAKSDIVDAIEFKGVEVPVTAKLDDMPEYIMKIGEEPGELGPIYTSYIIDLSLAILDEDELLGSKLPEDMIIGKAAKDCLETVEMDGETVYKNVIRRIRANSHCYVSQYTATGPNDGNLQLWLLSDSNKTLLKDEETYIWDTTDTYSHNYEDNIVMKLPRFWWKIEALDENLNRLKVSFCMTESAVDNTWNEWDGKTCIGVYKASNTLGRITHPNNAQESPIYYYSHSGEKVVTNAPCRSFHIMTSASVNKAIDFETHQIMMLLGYGWYSTTAIERYIGNAMFNETTGRANYFGMEDTNIEVLEEYVIDRYYQCIPFNNFWGLENWIGGGYEFIPWISCDTRNSNFSVVLNNDITLQPSCNSLARKGLITKLKLYNNKYLLPYSFINNSNFNRGFTSYGNYRFNKLTYATRAGIDTTTGGLSYLNFEDLYDSSDTLITSRLIVKPSKYVTIQIMN